ncbi:hypothetical protein P9112_008720 [Eukaryota sp. TZLM1-RC]
MSLLKKRASSAVPRSAKPKASLPSLDEYISKRDWTGAICYLRFLEERGSLLTDEDSEHVPEEDRLLWLAYCHFHNSEYADALEIYQDLAKKDSTLNLLAACCFFHLNDIEAAQDTALQCSSSPLRTRLLFQCAQKTGDETKLLQYLNSLTDDLHDHLSLACVRHLRSQHSEALESFKDLVSSHPNALCLVVYAALSYYSSDNFEAAVESLTPYLRCYPNSIIATNLRACCAYRLYSGDAALQELQPLLEQIGVSDSIDGYLDHLSSLISNNNSPAQLLLNALLFHNIVVFKNGEGALRVLPKLVHDVPEAKLNLAVFYLKAGDYSEAYELLREYEPLRPYEFVLKGLICLAVGQETSSEEHLNIAAQYFQLVGTSETECDTIQGRQAMSMAYFLNGQYDDVLIYLKSISDFFPNDDDFNFNYGITLAATGNFKEAEEAFLSITDLELKLNPNYCSWLIKSFIQNGKPDQAWKFYHEAVQVAESVDSMYYLTLIANDCYKLEFYFYSAKAYELLCRLDPNVDYLLGKKNSCIGVLKKIYEGYLQPELLPEIVTILQGDANNDSTINQIITTITKYAAIKGISL